ncbi:MAG: hypothetical protein V4621_01705 [Pseudomonadota bacterium]
MPNESLHTSPYVVDITLETALEESRMTYRMLHESGENPNIDYAGYCGHMALCRFKNLLNDPTLTPDKLAGMMRRAAQQHHQRAPNLRWSRFMADFISRHSNANLH